MKLNIWRLTSIGFAIVAVTSAAYGYRTREIAMQGWSAAQAARAEAQTSVGEDKDLVLRMIGLAPGRDYAPNALNAAVRDYVYRANVGGNCGTDAPDRETFVMISRPGGGCSCSGMAVAHAWALNEVGVPARVVQLAGEDYLDGRDLYQTHVTVEADLGGKWQISDPTFNVSFDCSDGRKNLSIIEAKQCIDAGLQLVGVPGDTQITGKGRTLADFPTPYSAYFAAIAPAKRKADVAQISYWPDQNWVQKAQAQYD